jgi:hypothetical protein
METSEFDEGSFFRAIAASGARAILIGRRALIALGIPVLTADYDFWVHPDDIEALRRPAERRGGFAFAPGPPRSTKELTRCDGPM